jgi:predicted dehydrogenase
MLNLAIVGLGRWGQVLVDAVQGRSDKLRFARAVSRTPEKAAAFAAQRGLALGGDLAAVLADKAIDGIVLATPHSQHAEQVAATASAGKPVFVEKPFTLDKASAEHAVAAARRAGIVLAFGHNRRFLPAMAELKRRVAAGELGELMHVEGNFSAPGGYRYGRGHWRADRAESPAGGMAGLGIHLVDAMIHLCGEMETVHAISRRRVLSVDVDDTTCALFGFRNGMSGMLATLTATAPIWRLRVMGSRGWAEMQGESRLVGAGLEGPVTETTFPPVNAERAELEAFADAIAGGAPYPVPAGEAVHGVAVFEAVARSAASDATVSV